MKSAAKTDGYLGMEVYHFDYIDHKEAKAIAGALAGNTILQELDLGGNNIGDEGARAFLDNLDNTNLLFLSLKYSLIDPTIVKEINTKLEERRKSPIIKSALKTGPEGKAEQPT